MPCRFKIAPWDKITWILTLSVFVLLRAISYSLIPLDEKIDTITVLILLSIWAPIFIVYVQ